MSSACFCDLHLPGSISTAVITDTSKWLHNYPPRPPTPLHTLGLLKEKPGLFILASRAGVQSAAGPQQAFVGSRQKRTEGDPWLQAHLGGRHVFKGDVAIGQLTGRDSHAVDVRLGIVTLEILYQERRATGHSTGALVVLRQRSRWKLSPNQDKLRGFPHLYTQESLLFQEE